MNDSNAQDNPYSNRDEALRRIASEHIRALQEGLVRAEHVEAGHLKALIAVCLPSSARLQGQGLGPPRFETLFLAVTGIAGP